MPVSGCWHQAEPLSRPLTPCTQRQSSCPSSMRSGRSNAADRGVRLQAIQRFTTNWWTRVRVKPDQLLAPAASWATLDYRHAITLDACGMSRWHAQRGGVVHGVAVWFEGQLFGDVVLSNAPTAPELVYGNAFFPWSEPVSVAAGDEITVRFDVRRVGDDYVWRWVSEVRATDGHVKGAVRPVHILRVADRARPARARRCGQCRRAERRRSGRTADR